MTEALSHQVRAKANALAPFLSKTRRHLHAHPELSFEEHETMAFVCAQLDDAGIAYRAGIAGTGIVVDIEGNGPGPVVALRGDMDALPIE